MENPRFRWSERNACVLGTSLSLSRVTVLIDVLGQLFIVHEAAQVLFARVSLQPPHFLKLFSLLLPRLLFMVT